MAEKTTTTTTEVTEPTEETQTEEATEAKEHQEKAEEAEEAAKGEKQEAETAKDEANEAKEEAKKAAEEAKQTNSLNESVLNALKDSINLAVQRIEQVVTTQKEIHAQVESLEANLSETLEAFQQVVAEMDERSERLALATNALVILQEKHERRNREEQQKA